MFPTERMLPETRLTEGTFSKVLQKMLQMLKYFKEEHGTVVEWEAWPSGALSQSRVWVISTWMTSGYAHTTENASSKWTGYA